MATLLSTDQTEAPVEVLEVVLSGRGRDLLERVQVERVRATGGEGSRAPLVGTKFLHPVWPERDSVTFQTKVNQCQLLYMYMYLYGVKGTFIISKPCRRF